MEASLLLNSKMPFESKAQMKAAFGGHLGPEMKKKARTWAHETPSIKSLPAHKHHSGKGTRARLNTVAEKHFFKSKLSK